MTAQKRSESLKDVPLSISVIDGTALDRQKIANYEDLGRTVPGLSVTNTGSSNLSRLTLRGVASDQGSATVGVYLDEVSLTIPNLFFTGATLPNLFDLQQVEVLRDPQGTLYGASSMGGTIRFITKKPDLDTFSADVRGDISSTKRGGTNYLVQGVVNIPIVSDVLAVRIGVRRADDSGYVDRIREGGRVFKGVNDERSTTVRASILYKPSDTLTIEPALLWQDSKSNGVGLFNLSLLPDYLQTNLIKEFNNDRLTAPSLTIKADLGGVELTSVSSYLNRVNKRDIDARIYDSEYIGFLLDPDFGNTYDRIAGLPGVFKNNVYAKQWTQELRLGSKSIKDSGKPYEWQVGAYYSNQKIFSTDDEFVFGLNDAIGDIFGQSAEQILGVPAPNDKVGYFHYNNDVREIAIFSEASLQLADKLKATVGLRQSFAKVHFDISEGGFLALGIPATKSRDFKDSPFTPKFTLSYKASDRVNFYATAAKGFRLGGSSAPLPANCAASVAQLGLTGDGETYTSDSLWSYEVGGKFQSPGGRFRLSASAYYIDWKKIQQRISLPSCGYVTVVNAGDARSYGGEIELQAQLSDALSVTIGGTVVDAEVTNAFAGAGAENGQWLTGVPKSTVSAGFEYRKALSASLEGYLQAQASWTGKSFGSFDRTSSDYRRPDYAVVNLVVGAQSDRFDISLFVRNLLNEDKIIQSPSVVFVQQGLTLRPRTIGASVSMNF
ncbi:MAG TPA: TonB-dependent receptor [Sphingobium sp.]|uniref:TonB-dependent receptor n=1 Tax=Sphingobium sp. TaxID=1912891 RepID=UPI002ED59500